MSIDKGIEYFIKPNLECIRMLFIGKIIPIVCKLLPNAEIYYVNEDNDEIVNLPIKAFDIIIDHDYLIHSDNIRVFEPIYKFLKNDGMLLGIGYDKNDMDISKDYMFLARYSLFDDFTFFEENKTFVIRIRKYKKETIELKNTYTENVRKNLSRLLHRLEANLYVANSLTDLAMLCDKYEIDDIYLNKFINNAIICKDNVVSNICYNIEIDLKKVQRVRDVLGNNGYAAQSKIAFIICVNNDELYDELLLYLSDLIVPKGYGVEIVDIKNAKSMCNGYNQALRSTDAKYKVYIHQDTYIYNKNFIKDILCIFENKNIGCIGLAGTSKLPENGIWWRSDSRCGRVIVEKEFEECNVLDYGQFKGLYQKAEAVDGFLIVTQYDVAWREDLFTGWHFYDISMCMEMRMHGYDVVVANQGSDYWALHCPGNKMLELAYEEYRSVFINEYLSNV